MKRVVATVLICFMLAGLIPGVYAEETVPANLARQLMVSGNKIVYLDDPETMVRLAGVNIPSLEWGDKGEHIFESLTEGCDGWNANIVRLPLSPTRWFDETIGGNYQNIVKEVVEGVTARGKYVLLDCHTYIMPTQEVYDFWMDASDKYGNNPGVLFGLCNEPHDIKGMNEDEGKSQWELWHSGGTINISDEATVGIGHQQLVEAIRDKGAKNILVAGGLSWGYDLRGITEGYALVDRGSDGDISKAGYGIMYDSHIYPSKGLKDSWDKCAGCVRDFAPLLIGEMGWDPKDGNISNDTSVYNLWMPQLLDWIDDKDGTYGVPANWTAWCFHPSASPRVITSWKYIPTYFNGVYVKDRLLSYADTGFYSDRVYENTFDPDMFTGYSAVTHGSETGKKVTVKNGAVELYFKRSADSNYVGYSMNLPSDWCLEGLQTLEMDITPKSSAITNEMHLEVGFRGSDTEIWGKTITLTDTNTMHVSINVNELENLAPVINADNSFTYGIIGVYVGAAKNTEKLVKGDVVVDNIKITTSADPAIPMPAPYVRPANNPQYLFDNDNEETTLTIKKNDNGPGSSQGDYFTTTLEEGVGYNGSTGFHVKYNRINGVWGGHTLFNVPSGTDCSDAVYGSFMLKGCGVKQQLAIKIGSSKATVVLEEGDTEWHQFTFRLSQLGCMMPEDIQSFEIHADNKIETELWADNFQITKDEPIVFIQPDDLIFENGFEDSIITFNPINGEQSTVTGGYVDGGFNSQRAYQLDYNNVEFDSGATAVLKTPTDWDYNSTDTFTFDAKTVGNQPIEIELGLLDKVGVAAYTGKTHTLTGKWQKFTVPIYDYKLNEVAIVNSRIRGIHIKSGKTGESTVIIDNISFSNCEVEPPVAYAVNYLNTFDEDVYGTYTSVNCDESNYINASVKDDAGYETTAGLVIDFAGNQGSSRYIDITGFPAEWDFSKAKYAGFMVKGNNPIVTSGYQVNGNTFVMEWYYDYQNTDGTISSVKTASINFDAHRGVWSNIITPIVPNTTNSSHLKGTNKIRIYGTRKMTGGIIIDNLGFYDMKPEREVPDLSATFTETFDNSSMLDINFKGGYYADQDNYLYKHDGGAYKHWGLTVQSAHTQPGVQQPASGKDYVEATLPMSWEIFRTTHISFKGRLNKNWKAKNFDNVYTALPDGGLTETTMTISLLDDALNEYSAQVEITAQSYTDFTVPLASFVNSAGEKPDLADIKYVRLYADEFLAQSGFSIDNFGFTTASPVVKLLTVTSEEGEVKDGGNVTTTCTLENEAKLPITLVTALYKDGVLESSIVTKSNQPTVTTVLNIPPLTDGYKLKAFVWYNDMDVLDSGYLEFN